MPLLDIRTVLLSLALSHAVCLAFMGVLWTQRRRDVAGLDAWLGFYGLGFLALLLLLLRGTVPVNVSVALADPVAALGCYLLLRGLLAFNGVQDGRLIRSDRWALAAFILAHEHYTFLQPSIAARTGMFSLLLALFGGQGVYFMVRRTAPGDRKAARLTVWALLGFAVISLLRLAMHFGSPPAADLFGSGPGDALAMLGYGAALLMLTFGLFLLVDQRLYNARESAELALSESEGKFELAFKTSPGAASITRLRDGSYLELNDAYGEMSGFSRAELLGASSTALKIWADEGTRDRIVAKLRAGENVVGEEIRFRRKSGELRSGLFTAGLLRLDGEAYILSTTVDITERLQAENALRESENRFRSIFRNNSSAMAIIERDTRISAVNEQYCRLSGYSEQEVVGMSWVEQIPPEDLDRLQQFNRMRLQDPASVPSQYEFKFIRKDGQVRDALVSVDLLPATGQIICSFTDMTDHKLAQEEKRQLEAQLAQAQKMESVGRLAGGVAHDFNNMLSVILGYADVALSSAGGHPGLEGNLREIKRAALRSADLTKQLLAFARKQPVIPEALDLNEAVKGTLGMLRRLLGEDIRLEWSPVRSPWKVLIDPSQVDQVLANLCVNARDAMAGGGCLSISTSNVALQGTAARDLDMLPGDYALLEVRDDGCGMDAMTLAHIFEPFFTTKDLGIGTGLGLSTVYGIVKQNHGYINVRSEPGHGTCFRVYLPRAAMAGGAASPPEAVEVPGRGKETVLVVEDEPAILKLAMFMLESQGYRVLAAASPVEALELAKANSRELALLLTDVIMPQMNGPELAKALQSLYPGLKCVFMSGYPADVIAPHGVMAEGTHFIQKPFNAKGLFGTLREALDEVPAAG